MKIVYLHGLHGSVNNEKVTMLKEKFGAENVIAPSLPVNPDEVEHILHQIFHSYPIGEKIIFVGTSLGAFWAAFAAQEYNAYCVMVNPCYKPSELLPKLKVDVNVAKYYHSYEYLIEIVDHIRREKLFNLFVAKDDEVFDYFKMLEEYPDTAYTKITPDGGHRYLSNWNLVIDRIGELVYGTEINDKGRVS